MELILLPETGGSIASFTWQGIDIFREIASGKDPLSLASFPLVPFCNRIDQGQFSAGAKRVRLAPINPEAEPVHALHGYGWMDAWQIVEETRSSANIRHRHDGGQWPWAYEAQQHLVLTSDGFLQRLSLINQGNSPMPTGLGFHPYFPREGAVLDAPVRAIWHNGEDRLPSEIEALDRQPHWFAGWSFDNCFVSDDPEIAVTWPTHRLTLRPDPALCFTHVYVPAEEPFFCVEPVSHMPDAVNRKEPPAETGLRWLEPGESWSVECRFAVEVPG